MATLPKPRYTPEQYLAMERRAQHKSEYYRGEIFAMAGATREHNLIVLSVGSQLRDQLRKRPCEVYPSDMRVLLPTGLYTYPDVTVVCGEPDFLDDEFDTLLNPRVLVEVISESTEAYDRGKKFEHYRAIESLFDYVLIDTDRAHVEVYSRQPGNHWLLSESSDLAGGVAIPSIECRLELREVYEKVPLKQNEDSGSQPTES